MAEYEARRDDDKEAKKAEDHEANIEASKLGIHAGAKYVPGVLGGFFKAGEAIENATNDGKSGVVSKAGAYGADIGNKFAPLAQPITNALVNTGAAKKANKVLDAKNSKGASVADEAKETADKAKEGTEKAQQVGAKGKDLGNQMKKGGEDKDSLPSSGGKNTNPNEPKQANEGSNAEQNTNEEEEKTEAEPSNEKKKTKTSGIFAMGGLLPVVIIVFPFMIIMLLFVMIFSVVNSFSDYVEAFGISQFAGLNTGGLNGEVADSHQKDFYKRVMDVKSEFAEDGKVVDPLLVVSVFHAFNFYNANLTYDDMTKMRIQEIAGSMFDEEGIYDKNLFIENLKEYIIPDYFPKANDEAKDEIVKEIFDYIERYYSIIGQSSSGDATTWKQYDAEWASTKVGTSGNTVKQIGCLVTSIAIQISRSGVQTNIPNFNPGTLVEALNEINAFSSGGSLLDYNYITKVVPAFQYQGFVNVKGMDKETKLNRIKEIVNQENVYAVAEVKGDTGQHWVAIESVSGDTINMIDPASNYTNMWDKYEWYNTSRIVYFKAD